MRQAKSLSAHLREQSARIEREHEGRMAEAREDLRDRALADLLRTALRGEAVTIRNPPNQHNAGIPREPKPPYCIFTAATLAEARQRMPGIRRAWRYATAILRRLGGRR
jgi:hypothetical protein